MKTKTQKKTAVAMKTVKPEQRTNRLIAYIPASLHKKLKASAKEKKSTVSTVVNALLEARV